MAGLRNYFQSEFSQAFFQCDIILFVPLTAIFQTFFKYEPQRFVQRVIHRNGRDVVINELRPTIRRQQSFATRRWEIAIHLQSSGVRNRAIATDFRATIRYRDDRKRECLLIDKLLDWFLLKIR